MQTEAKLQSYNIKESDFLVFLKVTFCNKDSEKYIFLGFKTSYTFNVSFKRD